ncbi:6823_t:CDS:2 [Diversispora eburnea]|uniref:6823_t:CDS:1 n=1 Tax=Diversispora eburnea TaxID=1213867 RepID=A0A9N9EZH9_9GLOM|nr:6823_t:CDS:2 [Diversispora eburnea]
MQSSLSIEDGRLDLSQKLSSNNSVELLSSSYKNQYHNPSLMANLLYKLTELAALTSAVASETYQSFIIENRPVNYHDEDDESMSYEYDEDYEDYEDYGEIMQIGFGDDEEEPPPPYEITWSMVRYDNIHRRRLIRSRINISKSRAKCGREEYNEESLKCDDDEEFVNFNSKLLELITNGKEALTSKVEVTELEMFLAEEKERDEKIMKELGIQTPLTRRSRRNTLTSSDSEKLILTSTEEKEREEIFLKEVDDIIKKRSRRNTGSSISSDSTTFSDHSSFNMSGYIHHPSTISSNTQFGTPNTYSKTYNSMTPNVNKNFTYGYGHFESSPSSKHNNNMNVNPQLQHNAHNSYHRFY